MYKKWGLQRGLTVASVFLLIAVMAMTAAAQSLESITYNNPIDIGIADPCVIRASDGRFYLYSTGLSVWSSDDLVNWKRGRKRKAGQRGAWQILGSGGH